jgi:hypothetical protein
VAYDPEAVAAVGQSERGCCHTTPFSIKPAVGQGSKNVSEPGRKEAWDVLQQDELDAQLASEPHNVKEKPGALSVDADALAPLDLSDTGVLAGEAGGDCVHGNSVCAELSPVSSRTSSIDRHSRPMLSQHAPAERIDLAERDRLEPARALQPEVEAANTRKKGQNGFHISHADTPNEGFRFSRPKG